MFKADNKNINFSTQFCVGSIPKRFDVVESLIDLIPVELNYYALTVSLDKCNGSCNVTDDLSTKIWIPSETKDVNLKVFTMITRINKTKTLAKHTLYDCKCEFDCTTCNSNQKWNNEICQCKSKTYRMWKKDYG